MRALRSPIGVIPRGFADHRRMDARRYRAYCLAIQAQWGPVPAVALPALREAGRLVVDLERMGAELDVARGRKRYRQASRLRRQMTPARSQLFTLERRVEELARSNGHRKTPMTALAEEPEATA